MGIHICTKQETLCYMSAVDNRLTPEPGSQESRQTPTLRVSWLRQYALRYGRQWMSLGLSEFFFSCLLPGVPLGPGNLYFSIYKFPVWGPGPEMVQYNTNKLGLQGVRQSRLVLEWLVWGGCIISDWGGVEDVGGWGGLGTRRGGESGSGGGGLIEGVKDKVEENDLM